jgi:hypothetical protein
MIIVNGSLPNVPAALVQAPPEQPSTEAAETELAREVQNPLSKLGWILLRNEVDLGMYPDGRVRNVLAIRPTYGFALTDDVSVVSRTAIPIVSRPDITQPQPQTSGYVSGLGDVAESLFIVPKPSSGVLWGIGPTVLLPTATDSALGAGKLALGPTAAALMQTKPWTFGVIAVQIWPVAGASDRPNVGRLGVTPFAALRFPGGWYVNTAPNITASESAGSAPNRWTVPIGGAFGKVFLAGGVPLHTSLGAYWNAIRPDGAPNMSVVVQFALLFAH